MVLSIFPVVFLWFSDVFSTHFTRDLQGSSGAAPGLRRLAKGHQLATGNKEARQDDQHATWKDERDKGMKIKLRDVFHLYNMRKSSGFKLKGYY